jgi:hypothetical protein
MKSGFSKSWVVAIGLVLLSGCYFPSTDFVKVEPVRFVPPPATPIPNTQFGWVEVSPVEAQGYRVRVGDLTYQTIIEPHKVGGKISYEAAVETFSKFAEKKVIEAEYCKSAHVPESSKKLYGSQRPPEMHMYVECNE